MDSAEIRRATRWPDLPRPGEFNGQDMASFHCFMPWEIAGLGKFEAATAAVATPAVAAPFINARRFIFQPPIYCPSGRLQCNQAEANSRQVI